MCRQLLCEIHSQHDPTRRSTAARWSDVLSTLHENCTYNVTAPTGGTTCTFWSARLTAADESPLPKVAHFHSHGQGSTLICSLSLGLFKDGLGFPLRRLYNVTLICFMSALQQRQAPETRRQSSWRTLDSASFEDGCTEEAAKVHILNRTIFTSTEQQLKCSPSPVMFLGAQVNLTGPWRVTTVIQLPKSPHNYPTGTLQHAWGLAPRAMPFEGIGRHHLKVTFRSHFPAQPTGPSLLNEGLIYCAISFYWHVLFSSFLSLLPFMLSLLFSFGLGGRRLRGDFPDLLHPCNSFQPCSSVRKSKDEQLYNDTTIHGSMHQSDSKALKVNAFLPHEIL